MPLYPVALPYSLHRNAAIGRLPLRVPNLTRSDIGAAARCAVEGAQGVEHRVASNVDTEHPGAHRALDDPVGTLVFAFDRIDGVGYSAGSGNNGKSNGHT